MPRAAIQWYYMLRESMQSAFRTVILNKLRTLLSLMGITIGIFAIIAVFTVLDSMEENIRESLSSLGSEIIYVEKWPWMPEDGQEYKWWEYLNRPVPSMRDYQLAEEEAAECTSRHLFCRIRSDRRIRKCFDGEPGHLGSFGGIRRDPQFWY